MWMAALKEIEKGCAEIVWAHPPLSVSNARVRTHVPYILYYITPSARSFFCHFQAEART